VKRFKNRKQDKQSGQTTGETQPKDLKGVVTPSMPEGSGKSFEDKPENIKPTNGVIYLFPIRVQEVENWENLFKVQG
jgi:hypothetical protein